MKSVANDSTGDQIVTQNMPSLDHFVAEAEREIAKLEGFVGKISTQRLQPWGLRQVERSIRIILNQEEIQECVEATSIHIERFGILQNMIQR